MKEILIDRINYWNNELDNADDVRKVAIQYVLIELNLLLKLEI